MSLTAGIAELTRTSEDRQAVPIWFAVAASLATIAVGNGIVLMSKAIGGTGGEVFTFVAVLTASAVAVVPTAKRFGPVAVGLTWPKGLEGRVRGVTIFAGVVVAGSVVLAAVRSTGSTDWKVAAPILMMFRVLFGTAVGEELIHRVALLTLWAATGVKPGTVIVANAVTFGLWHIVTAAGHGVWWPLHIVGPALWAFVLCWGRIRSGSIVVPWLLHCLTNAPGTAVGQ